MNSKSYPLRFGIASGQQNYSWEQLRHLWETADRLGYDSLWTGDHLFAILGALSEPTFEGWTTLAALGQHTSHPRIGCLVHCNGFRNPCLTAKMAATLDHSTKGRFVLGLGAGWFEQEHRRLGFEFPPARDRLRALDEACRIIKGMLAEGTATFHGVHQVSDATCSPKPIQVPRPPLMIAGQGGKILLRIVAEHADMWNTQGSPDRLKHLIEVMQRHGDRIGRDLDEIEKTVAIPLCYSLSKSEEQRDMKMAAVLGRTTPAEARRQMMIGSKQECLDKVGRYVEVGVTHFTLVSVRPFDVEEITRFAQEVIPAAR
jgi:alkanesulfonate monooxygenase SsuD/methylene tetrahydromethanopterin reductase-like flavin-dependent oxidoreductase (luciferase family)